MQQRKENGGNMLTAICVGLYVDWTYFFNKFLNTSWKMAQFRFK